ncbi:hypothetical protein F5Y16DRAFT_77040 [Xylariaceae sp. FL0255]|nr:hypothetical protein F5Y16DRAFT_77040 [Xylariaceae sp. FL0255]
MTSSRALLTSAASALLYLATTPVFAAQFTFTSDGCVDPDGFGTCWSNANAVAASLSAKYCSGSCDDADNCIAPDPNCGASVQCVAYAAWLNCALGHCWNRVYGCEYQNLAINAVRNCPLANSFPPYIPAPHAAPGYCSCNMGYVFYNFKEAETQFDTCRTNVDNSQASSGSDSCYPYCYKDQTVCSCCAASLAVSTFYNSCPTTDPSQFPLFSSLGYQEIQTDACLTNLTDPSTCSEPLFAYNITAGPVGDEDTVYLGSDLPQNGTDSITNNAGGPTSPTLGATLTWTFGGVAQTVTAVSVGKVVSAAPPDSGSSNSAAATAPAATSTKPGAGARLVVHTGLAIGVMTVVAAVVL